jgi:hypothetical protein
MIYLIFKREKFSVEFPETMPERKTPSLFQVRGIKVVIATKHHRELDKDNLRKVASDFFKCSEAQIQII